MRLTIVCTLVAGLPRVAAAPLLHNTSSVSRTYSACGVQPEEHRTQEALEALVVSAQFRSQLDVFGAALQSGQLDLAQFGLQAEVRLRHFLAFSAAAVVPRTCFRCMFCRAAAGPAAYSP